MPKKRIIEDESIGKIIDLTSWSQVLTDKMSESDSLVYLNRKKAVEMYFNNVSHAEIEEKTGIHRNHLIKFIKRCLELDEFGNVWGYRALIPRKRLKAYRRKKALSSTTTDPSPNKNGAFHYLLETYPEIRELIDGLFFKQSNRFVTDPVIRIKQIHKDFVQACRKIGLKPPHDYPFNTRELARRSLYNYINKLAEHNISHAASRNGEEASQLIRTTGAGIHNNAYISRPFEQVQFDGHKIDISLTLILYSPEGDEIVVSIERIWLLAVMDVGTKCILGYYISYNKEYTAADVLHCIRNSIVPWQPKKLTIPGLKFPEGGGIPSGVITETQWALWDELLYDQARANVSKIVKDRLRQIVKCQVNAGRIKYPMKRSLIERFFGLFEEAGIHRIISTTGSNPRDPRRNDPQAKAKKYRITAQHIEELIEVLIADYNATPNEGINFMTPLEALKSRILSTHAVNQMPEEQRNEVAFLTMQVVREIQGSIENGRRPYIQFENVRYSNEVLSRSAGLIGKKVDLLINVDDLRIIKAFLPDGSELGKLKAKGKWGITPHTLQVRREIYRLKNQKLIHFTSSDDPIRVYQIFLQQGIKTKKRNANKHHELERNIERNQTVEENLLVEQTDIKDIKIEETLEIPLLNSKIDNASPSRRKLRSTLIH